MDARPDVGDSKLRYLIFCFQFSSLLARVSCYLPINITKCRKTLFAAVSWNLIFDFLSKDKNLPSHPSRSTKNIKIQLRHLNLLSRKNFLKCSKKIVMSRRMMCWFHCCALAYGELEQKNCSRVSSSKNWSRNNLSHALFINFASS